MIDIGGNRESPIRSGAIGQTGIMTTCLGFGCARLIDVNDPPARRRLLETAYEAGIRHFDTAPMYGQGTAELDLAPLLADRRASMTISTKFGIEPTSIGKFCGRHRSAIAVARSIASEAINARKRSKDETPSSPPPENALHASPRAGAAERLLYRRIGYTSEVAARSLDASLLRLGTDYVDVLLIHEPFGPLESGAPELAAFLHRERDRGRIRAWGVAGERSVVHRFPDDLVGVQQFQFDALATDLSAAEASACPVTFGTLSHGIAWIRAALSLFPDELERWERTLGVTILCEEDIADLLLYGALHRNQQGVVLFSTTNLRHLVRAGMVGSGAGFTEAALGASSIAGLLIDLRRRSAAVGA